MLRRHCLSHCLAGLVALSVTSAGAEELIAQAGDQPNKVFDILRAEVRRDPDRSTVLFRIEVAGTAGASRPQLVQRVPGAGLFAYLWTLPQDPQTVGFGDEAGTLALAVMRHPDFDDTPEDDENGNGNLLDDGDEWHVHWLVLRPDMACGRSGIKVGEFPPGTPTLLPPRSPDLPLLIGSPGYLPLVIGKAVEVRVPVEVLGEAVEGGFDAWTASFRVNTRLEPPLWCMVDVLDSASGETTLPGSETPE